MNKIYLIETEIKEAERLLTTYQRFGEGLITKSLREKITKLKNKL